MRCDLLMWLRNSIGLVVVATCVVAFYGCDGPTDYCACCGCPSIPPQTVPAEDLKKLKWAYVQRDPISYAELLADDFRFYFDPATREEHDLPEFWTRVEDSTCTARLFSSEEISNVRLSVTEYDPVPELVNELGREKWRLIRMTDVKLEVDQRLQPGEADGITYLIEGQRHEFYFRKGRTPADTLTTSQSAQLWFIVEWHDLGPHSEEPLSESAAVVSTTWSELKVLYCK
jgi:hypothetical protein